MVLYEIAKKNYDWFLEIYRYYLHIFNFNLKFLFCLLVAYKCEGCWSGWYLLFINIHYARREYKFPIKCCSKFVRTKLFYVFFLLFIERIKKRRIVSGNSGKVSSSSFGTVSINLGGREGEEEKVSFGQTANSLQNFIKTVQLISTKTPNTEYKTQSKKLSDW